MEVKKLADFVTGALERAKRLGCGKFAGLDALLAAKLAFTGKFGLVTLGNSGALAGDIGGKDAEVGGQRTEAGVEYVGGGLIRHAKRENSLADLAFVNKRPKLRTVAKL